MEAISSKCVQIRDLQPKVAGLQCLWMATIDWHLGDVVRALRDRKGWTQEQLAKKAKMNKATVVSVEQMDRNHGSAAYTRLAHAFEISIAELYALVPTNAIRQSTVSEQRTTAAPPIESLEKQDGPALATSVPFPMAKLIPFRARRARLAAAARRLLALTGRYERLSKARPWMHPHAPERLGNLLQRLAFARPAVVFVIESLVAEMVRQLDAEGSRP